MRAPVFVRRWADACQRHLSRRRLCVDAVVIFGGALVLRLATYPLDLFERFHNFSRAHEAWELDEAAVTLTLLSAALIVFGIRRIQDQRRELALRRAAERRAADLAHHDPLTGLPNRLRFREAISSRAIKDGQLDAVMLIDLDGFTPVNDTMGQAGGDEALRIVAQRLRSISDHRGICARVGGDEFGLLVEDLASDREARQIAGDMLAAVQEPIRIGADEYRLRVSVGVALIDDFGLSGDVYLRHANMALHRAKEKRKPNCVIYEPSIDLAQQERIRLEQDLRRGLRERQIVPFYQPIVDLETGRIVKLEALARWRHPEEGLIPPFRFIPIAEDRGMIEELTEVILRQACADALKWPASITLAVNLSPALMGNGTFVLKLITWLSEAGVPPQRLEFEITECALEADLDTVQPFLARLRALGAQIALDDFGTGYSSLSRLQAIQFDELKIDRSFVQGIANPESAAILRTIVQLGLGLGMSLTAEGIELPEQRSWLLEQGCRHGQGYLFGRPAPADEIAEMLHMRGAAQHKRPSASPAAGNAAA
jgi:diguanylate cyclase (GGDEF)-like protein